MPFVESPIHRIAAVNFGIVHALTFLNLSFNAEMIPAAGIPQYPAADQFVMSVSTVNIPFLDRTELRAPPADNVFGFFPDGPSDFINGSYTLGQPEIRGPVSGGVNYNSSNSETPFGGATVISATITCILRAILNASGYSTAAQVVGGVKGGPDIIRTLTGTEAGGGTITYTATLDLVHSVLTLVSGA